jgi:hypothetical protein
VDSLILRLESHDEDSGDSNAIADIGREKQSTSTVAVIRQGF